MKWLSFQLELVSFSDFEYVLLSTHQAIAKSGLLMFYLKVVTVIGAVGSHNDGHSVTSQGMGMNMVLSLLFSYKKN